MKRLLRPVMTGLYLCLVLSIALFAAGCGKVTYPKESMADSVTNLCKREYGLDIDVGIAGKTLTIYLPLTNLFDITLNISENAQEKIQDVLLSASRVVLSTDADIQFYCIIAQDVRLPEIQLVIIKYTDDVKRAFFQDISRSEYFKRTIIDINENPQAKKEQAIIDVFKKMQLEEEWQTKVLDDFFRSPPSTMEGIGYWQEHFYIKDITLEEFLAQQMASRIKMKFREDENLREYAPKFITGKFLEENDLKIFLINLRADSLLFAENPQDRESMQKEIFKTALEEAGGVIRAYKFRDFDLVKIIEENFRATLSISKENLYRFEKGRLGISDILGTVN